MSIPIVQTEFLLTHHATLLRNFMTVAEIGRLVVCFTLQATYVFRNDDPFK